MLCLLLFIFHNEISELLEAYFPIFVLVYVILDHLQMQIRHILILEDFKEIFYINLIVLRIHVVKHHSDLLFSISL